MTERKNGLEDNADDPTEEEQKQARDRRLQTEVTGRSDHSGSGNTLGGNLDSPPA